MEMKAIVEKTSLKTKIGRAIIKLGLLLIEPTPKRSYISSGRYKWRLEYAGPKHGIGTAEFWAKNKRKWMDQTGLESYIDLRGIDVKPKLKKDTPKRHKEKPGDFIDMSQATSEVPK